MTEWDLVSISERDVLGDWIDQFAEQVRLTVSNNPVIRIMPYRRDAVALDFFEGPGLSGKSFATTIFISFGKAYMLPKLKATDDTTEITIPSHMDVLLVTSLIGKAIYKKDFVQVTLFV